MKKVRKWKKGTALLLAALLSIPVYAVNPLPTNAAEREVRTVNINIDNDLGIKNPEIPQNDTDEWKGDKVVFGVDCYITGKPIIFRVLDKKTSDFGVAGATTMFLDCDSVLHAYAFDDSGTSNVWETSPLRKELHLRFLHCFSEKENAAIYNSQNPSSHESWEMTWEDVTYGKLSPDGEKFFILDAREAEHEAYGYLHKDFFFLSIPFFRHYA